MFINQTIYKKNLTSSPPSVKDFSLLILFDFFVLQYIYNKENNQILKFIIENINHFYFSDGNYNEKMGDHVNLKFHLDYFIDEVESKKFSLKTNSNGYCFFIATYQLKQISNKKEEIKSNSKDNEKGLINHGDESNSQPTLIGRELKKYFPGSEKGYYIGTVESYDRLV